MRARKRGRGVLVGYSVDEALDHLRRDPSLPVRVRWALDAHAAAGLDAFLTVKQGAASSRSAFVDSFHGGDDLPAAGWWLRCRDVDAGQRHDPTTAPVAVGQKTPGFLAGMWSMRVVRRLGDRRSGGLCVAKDDDDGSERRAHRHVYVHTDIDDDARLAAMVAPDSATYDLATLSLGLYARVGVLRVAYDLPGSCEATATSPPLRVLVDRAALGGNGDASVLFYGTAVVRDAASALRLGGVLAAVGIDTSQAPPPSKVAAYLARRRPALYARLVQRGALDGPL